MRKEKMLTMTILTALAACGFSGGVVRAADYNLDTIYVEGERDKDLKPLGSMAYETQNVGLLGQKDALDTPFTSMTINAKEASYFASPARTLTDVLTLNPSVRNSSSSMYNDISIRGFNLNGHQMYVNGVPGLMDQQHTADLFVDNVTVISGPNLGIAGTTVAQSVGGTVEIQTKKAESKPNRDLTLSYLGGSSFQQTVDFGKRFGENQRYGVRVMAENTDGETSIDNEKLTQRDFFVNIDQKTTNSKTNIFAGYDYVHHQAAPTGFNLDTDKNGNLLVTRLPSAPDSGKNYKPDWYYMEYDSWLTAVNHEQKLNDHVTAFVNAGYHKEDWSGYVDGSPYITNDQGSYRIGQTLSPLTFEKKYIGVGIKGKFELGATTHDYMLSVDKSWVDSWLGDETAFYQKNPDGSYKYVDGKLVPEVGLGSLASGYLGGLTPTTRKTNAPHWYKEEASGWHVTDNISMLGERLQLLLGVHGHRVSYTNYQGSTDADRAERKSDAIAPTFALNYRITDDFSAYISHTENFMMGNYASNDTKPDGSFKYKNHGELFAPAKTKQNEFGFKLKNGTVLHTLSFYEITQPNYTDIKIGSDVYYGELGEQKNKGIEYTVVGSLTDKLDIVGGLNYLNAKQALTGKQVNGAAKWSGTLGLLYKATDNLSWIARAQYLGRAPIFNEKFDVPSHLVFDFGATYNTKLNDTPVTLTAMIYNAFGKDYWQARSGSNGLILSTPRTFVLSAGFHF